jgi:hypothetical protein
MPCLELEVKVMTVVVVSTLETPQPKSWLTGLGRKRRSVREGGKEETPHFELDE